MLLAWGMLGVTSLGMLALAVDLGLLGLDVVGVLLLGGLLLALGKASVEALGEEPEALGADGEESRADERGVGAGSDAEESASGDS